MIETAFPPGLLLIASALVIPALSEAGRRALLLILPPVTLAWIWIAEPAAVVHYLLGYPLHLFDPTPPGRLFATAFIIMVFAGNLFALNQARTFELAAASFYAGGAVCVALCGDFLSLLLFWELMMLGSTAVVFSAATKTASRAGLRYFLIHILSGALLMVGVSGLAAETGDLSLRVLQTGDLHTWFILAGFLINAGAPPLSAWIADAYPEASPSGMVYLSAFTTKAAVFALLVVFPGEILLVPLGLYMIFYGIIYALAENDMRRILAYSIVNQVGFMLVGIGIGTTLALNGAAAHAFTHIIYKALLLMSAGSVLMMTGNRLCTDLGGLYRSMPLTTACAIVGAVSIAGMPLTSGFISKPMIDQAAIDLGWTWLWFVLMTGSAGVFLHASIKFPWFVFFQKDSGLRPPDPPLNMRAAMLLLSFLCLLFGVFPKALYTMLPQQPAYVPYTIEQVVTKSELLLFAGAAFFVMLPLLQRTRTISLDTDWFYRKLLPASGRYCVTKLQHAATWLLHCAGTCKQRAITPLDRHWKTDYLVGKNAYLGAMVTWLAALLALLLLLFAGIRG